MKIRNQPIAARFHFYAIRHSRLYQRHKIIVCISTINGQIVNVTKFRQNYKHNSEGYRGTQTDFYPQQGIQPYSKHQPDLTLHLNGKHEIDSLISIKYTGHIDAFTNPNPQHNE